jgi:hypothetical protein
MRGRDIQKQWTRDKKARCKRQIEMMNEFGWMILYTIKTSKRIRSLKAHN